MILKPLHPPHLIRWVFFISSILILALAFTNNGSANDNHFEVGDIIYKTGKIPQPNSCWQCYHPKLYHYSLATIWRIFNIENYSSKILAAQLINGFAGVITLFFILSFIQKQTYNEHVKLLAFSLIALNPRIISIFAQASNDAFIILFGTLTLYYLFEFIKKQNALYFIGVILFSILAGLSKLNSLVIIIGVIVVLSIKIIYGKNYKFSFHKGYLGWLFVFIFTTVICVGIGGEFYRTYNNHGKLVVYNTPLGKFPHLYKKTNFRRPGVQSILGGYFTFRIFNMVKSPIITNDEHTYPKHRTSLWSQLYGRAHYLYFDAWPTGIWSKTTPILRHIGRASFILALIPSTLFLMGIFQEIKIWYNGLLKRNFVFLERDPNWIFHVFFFGFICFIILFTLRGRDFSFMKIIYIFPGILAAIVPLLKGLDLAWDYVSNKIKLKSYFNGSILFLLLLYIIPILNLIVLLALEN